LIERIFGMAYATQATLPMILGKLNRLEGAIKKIMANEQEVLDELAVVSTDLKAYKSAVDAYKAAHPDQAETFQKFLDAAKSIDAEVVADTADLNPPAEASTEQPAE